MKKGEVLEGGYGHVLTSQQLEQYEAIARGAAEEIEKPGAYTGEGVSVDSEGKSMDLWSKECATHDALGWILCVAARVLEDSTEHRSRCVHASVVIGRKVFYLERQSLIEINDDLGCDAIKQALLRAAESFHEELLLQTENQNSTMLRHRRYQRVP